MEKDERIFRRSVMAEQERTRVRMQLIAFSGNVALDRGR